MKNLRKQLFGRVDSSRLQGDIEEEFRFHIDMQARAYESEGLTPEEALTKAGVQFGDLAQIKNECLQIALQGNSGAIIMKVLFTIVFLAGVVTRSLSTELHVTRIGDVLMMIGFFGGLLLMCKRMRTGYIRGKQEPLRLGLTSAQQSIPLAFDEKGRTPFERVRGND